MEMLSRIKKIIYSIGVLFVMIPIKISNAYNTIGQPTQLLYGPPPEKMESYPGIIPRIIEIALTILKCVIVPLILVIGTIVFWRKTKFKKLIKIIIVGLVAAIVGIYIVYITLSY